MDNNDVDEMVGVIRSLFPGCFEVSCKSGLRSMACAARCSHNDANGCFNANISILYL